jgi:hypothetical protein
MGNGGLVLRLVPVISELNQAILIGVGLIGVRELGGLIARGINGKGG